MIKPNPFVVIIDKDGDVAENLSVNSTIDYILDMVRIFDNKFIDDAPHSAWEWNGKFFYQVKDIEVKSVNLQSAKSIKV